MKIMNESLIKKIFWVLLNLVLVVVVSSGLYLNRYLNATQNSLPPTRTITVSAEGKTVAIPDIAIFEFSVITEGLDVKAITSDNSKKTNADARRHGNF
jgi:uncharacterized protein YggE